MWAEPALTFMKLETINKRNFGPESFIDIFFIKRKKNINDKTIILNDIFKNKGPSKWKFENDESFHNLYAIVRGNQLGSH